MDLLRVFLSVAVADRWVGAKGCSATVACQHANSRQRAMGASPALETAPAGRRELLRTERKRRRAAVLVSFPRPPRSAFRRRRCQRRQHHRIPRPLAPGRQQPQPQAGRRRVGVQRGAVLGLNLHCQIKRPAGNGALGREAFGQDGDADDRILRRNLRNQL